MQDIVTLLAEMWDQIETEQSNKHKAHLTPQLLKGFEDYALFSFVASTWVYKQVASSRCSLLLVSQGSFNLSFSFICSIIICTIVAKRYKPFHANKGAHAV